MWATSDDELNHLGTEYTYEACGSDHSQPKVTFVNGGEIGSVYFEVCILSPAKKLITRVYLQDV
jgi:hypothetical protein